MEKEEILRRTKDLPTIVMGNVAEDHQIWEGNEGGTHFKITKEIIPIPKGPMMYALSVSGDERYKARLISDFENALGKPATRNTDPRLPGIEFVLWEATKIDKQRKQ